MSQTRTKLLTHIVFSTKNRSPYLGVDIQPQVFGYMAAVLNESFGTTVIIGGMPDHIHILIDVHATTCVSELVRDVKARTTAWVRKEFDGLREFAWQSGYGAFSVSESTRDTVAVYIKNQAEHHRERGYKAELIAFYDKHGLDYDERYLWD